MLGRSQLTDDECNERILSGATWDEFCDALKMAGGVIMREGSPTDAFNRAEGFRYLSRITRAALETFVEHADPRAPVLQRVVHETVKMGSDNPDNYYRNAAISGEFEYRIRGTRGTAHYLGFGTQSGGYGEGGSLPPTGYLEAKDMLIEDDGTFEIIMSCKEQPGNRLPMTPETGTLIVRQTFLDRSTEVIADLCAERIGGTSDPTPMTAAAIDRGRPAYRLDGDNVRHGVNKNLGFAPEDRTENIRRVGEISKLFADSGMIALASFISPYRADRDLCRSMHEEGGLPFIEVFVDCPLDEAERRDPKGLYKKARAGLVKDFTGVDAPYEAPIKADVHLRSDQMTVVAEVAAVLAALERAGIIPTVALPKEKLGNEHTTI